LIAVRMRRGLGLRKVRAKHGRASRREIAKGGITSASALGGSERIRHG